IFNSYPSYSNWDVNISNKNLDELWNPKQIVYLTADSNNLLETLNEDKVYIIGGLLDHNHHKGVCLKKAEDNGYEHARLPIESFFKLCGRNVLTINQVFEILVNFCQSLDWKKAFLDVIPKRKGIAEEISSEYKKGEELMDERTVRKTISQLAYCYAVNRRVSDPIQFSIVGLTGKAEKIFNSYPSYSNWDVNISNKNLDELWNPKQIVYLTADSNNLLETLNEDKVYIIGGLLDHNHHKGVCLKKAEDNGYEHARLPIESFFKLCGRNVLTINQVFEILVNFCQSLDWKKAFLDVIPKRKGIAEEISSEYKKREEVSLEELTNE
uniref:tRNA (guanine(9)-N(1))-methyltransferase n=1 Tax=Meloidogyne incognita TaxID=6306 RepID=A0A914NVX9_MELIC